MYINPYNNPALSQKWRFLRRFVIGFMGYCGFLLKNIKILNLLTKTTITHKPDHKSSQKSTFLRRTWVIVRVNVTRTLTRGMADAVFQRVCMPTRIRTHSFKLCKIFSFRAFACGVSTLSSRPLDLKAWASSNAFTISIRLWNVKF